MAITIHPVAPLNPTCCLQYHACVEQKEAYFGVRGETDFSVCWQPEHPICCFKSFSGQQHNLLIHSEHQNVHACGLGFRKNPIFIAA